MIKSNQDTGDFDERVFKEKVGYEKVLYTLFIYLVRSSGQDPDGEFQEYVHTIEIAFHDIGTKERDRLRSNLKKYIAEDLPGEMDAALAHILYMEQEDLIDKDLLKRMSDGDVRSYINDNLDKVPVKIRQRTRYRLIARAAMEIMVNSSFGLKRKSLSVTYEEGRK